MYGPTPYSSPPPIAMLPSTLRSSVAARPSLVHRIQRAALVALALTAVACNSDDDGGQTFPGGGAGGGGELGASGVLSLSGSDTSAIGSDFVIGDGAREITDSFPTGYLFVDSPKMFTAAEYAASEFDPLLDIVGFDPQNTTLFAVIVDESGAVIGVSMGVRLNGIDYGYTCTGVTGASGQACGDAVFDQDAGEFIFNGVILEPDQSLGSTDLLTLDGVISLSQ